MTIAVICQSGMIGSSIIKFSSNEYINFPINEWSKERFHKQINTNIINLKSKNIPIDFVWAAGISNNSSGIKIIENEMNLIKIFLETITKTKVKIEYHLERAGDVKHSLADISKTIEEIQYNNIVDFGDGIKLTFEYYKNSYLNE